MSVRVRIVVRMTLTQADSGTAVLVWNPHAPGPYAPDSLAHVLELLGDGWDLDRVVAEYPHVIVFEHDTHPCGCPSEVVTSVLRGWREQCSRCGATFDSPDPL